MQKTQVIGKEISSKYFHWFKDSKNFSCELSDLPHNDITSQIWNDSCDAGFVMVSEKTGKKLIFIFNGTDRDREGEVQGYRFTAYQNINKGILTHDVLALVIND